ncbi:hypothetical protein EDD27_3905 [Nonomuraea polychroma]|uniref:Uncharacterized protein n=1 Tax=Nonomuraea polychroma TaxID=46176 RepID=A0A438M6Q2_9ACTN|nr:hypothetical protein EDD27_3905 [Nonomuraea polychroma]
MQPQPGVSAGVVQAHLVAELTGRPQADAVRRARSGFEGEALDGQARAAHIYEDPFAVRPAGAAVPVPRRDPVAIALGVGVQAMPASWVTFWFGVAWFRHGAAV